MFKYSEDETMIKKFGEEWCKKRDSYYEDQERRYQVGFNKVMANMPLLVDKIRKSIGIEDIGFEIKNENNGIYIESEDISKKVKVLNLGWEEFKIETENTYNVSKQNKPDLETFNETDFSKPCPDVGFCLTLCYKYRSYSGWSNGVMIASVYFWESNDWNIEYKTNIE